MTDTSITASVFPQCDGTGVPDGSESRGSAAIFALLSSYIGGEYVGNGLAFANVDTGANQVDITAGHAYIVDDLNIGSSARSNRPITQTTDFGTYDFVLPDGTDMPYVVLIPQQVVDLQLDEGVNDIWLAIDPRNPEDAFIRHGTGLTTPESDVTPFLALKLGTVDTGPSGATTRPNDDPLLALRGLGGSIAGNDVIDNITGENLSINAGALDVNANFTPNLADADIDFLIQNDDFPYGMTDRPLMDNGGRTDYYVAPGGNDNNPGTQAQPFQTMDRVLREIPHIVYGLVNIHVANGTYNNAGGTTRTPFSYMATPYSMVAIGQDLGNRAQNLTQTTRGGNAHITDVTHTGALGRPDQCVLKGIESDGQQLNGAGMDISCQINGYAQNVRAFGTKSGHFIVEDCLVGDVNHTHSFLFTNSPFMTIRGGSRLNSQNQAIDWGEGGMVFMTGDCNVNGNNVGGLNNNGVLNFNQFGEGNTLVVDDRLFVNGRYVGGG